MKKHTLLGVLSLLFLYTSTTTLADEPNPSTSNEWLHSWALGGKLFSGHFYRVKKPLNPQPRWMQNSWSAWLEVSHPNILGSSLFENKDTESLSFHSTLLTSLFLNSLNQPGKVSTQFYFHELYTNFQSDAWDIKAGELVIPWGKSDGVNPTDYFTSKNYSFLAPSEEVRRMGALSTLVQFTPDHGASPLQLSLVVQGRNPKTELLVPDSIVPTGITFIKNPTYGPIFSTETLQAGFKAALLKSSYDLSLSMFRGAASMPHYEFDGTKIYSTFSKQTSVGFDASFTHEANIVRIESALHAPDDGAKNNPNRGLTQPKRIETVLGVERPLWGDWRGQIQLLHRYHFYYLSPDQIKDINPMTEAILKNVARANATLLNFQNQQFVGATFRLSFLPEQPTWSGDLFLVGYFWRQKTASSNSSEQGDYLLKPQVTYQPKDSLKLTLGMDLYGGDKNKTLGAMRDFSSVYFESKFMF